MAARIVSLVPSATETLVSWGLAPIACTRFCEQPDLLHVGGTKDPDIQRILELDPDLVIVDTEENRREDFETLVAHGLSVHVLSIKSIDDVDASMTELAAHVGAHWTALPTRDRAALRFRAFVPIWRRPWMALGEPTYGASVLRTLGIATVFAEHGPYPTVTLEAARTLSPDVVLAPSEPYPFSSRQRAELESVAPTIFLDGKDLFWWGARSAGALERLSRLLSTLPRR